MERDDGKMSPLREELNRQIEPDAGLAADEDLRGSAPGSSRPS
jgi:hypothetical protein